MKLPKFIFHFFFQINNESALDFYKRFGFEVVGVAEKYYKRIEPDSAYILVKKIEREVRDHLP